MAESHSGVAEDVQRVTEDGRALGLHLNVSKCELITSQSSSLNNSPLKSFKVLDVAEASLLGTFVSKCFS